MCEKCFMCLQVEEAVKLAIAEHRRPYVRVGSSAGWFLHLQVHLLQFIRSFDCT